LIPVRFFDWGRFSILHFLQFAKERIDGNTKEEVDEVHPNSVFRNKKII
jgi:hypothetical protein